jgi:hypothetical protein
MWVVVCSVVGRVSRRRYAGPGKARACYAATRRRLTRPTTPDCGHMTDVSVQDSYGTTGHRIGA